MLTNSAQRGSRKGQIFSVEFMLTLPIFAVVVVLGFLVHDQQLTKLIVQEEYTKLNQRAFQTADFLIRTRGYPKDWNTSSVKLVGFANPDHVLQDTLISQFNSMDYETSKAKLKIFPYQFYMEINSSSYTSSKGLLWDESARQIVVEERVALLNNSGNLERATLRLFIWR